MFNYRLKGTIYHSCIFLAAIISCMFHIKVHFFSTVVKVVFIYNTSRLLNFIHAGFQKEVPILYIEQGHLQETKFYASSGFQVAALSFSEEQIFLGESLRNRQ